MTGAGSELPRRLSDACADGILRVQRCAACGEHQYPPRDICRACLGDDLPWTPVGRFGRLVALTQIHGSLEPSFTQRLPWTVGLVLLEQPALQVMAHVAASLRVGDRVAVHPVADDHEEAALCATPASLAGPPPDLDSLKSI